MRRKGRASGRMDRIVGSTTIAAGRDAASFRLLPLVLPAPGPGNGYQLHHLLPLSLARDPALHASLGALASHGFSLADRTRNCIWLPAEEGLARHFGLALHRGPHPHYTAVVRGRVRRILRDSGQGPAGIAIARLHRLQRTLAAVLDGTGPRLFTLNRRDPMRSFGDYSYLDALIDQDWTRRPLPGAPSAAGDQLA